MGLPASSGATPSGILRIGYPDHSWDGVELNFGIVNDNGLGYPAWIQAQRTGYYGTSRPLLLNPNGGNVGIGTTSPQSILDISNTSPTINLRDTGTYGVNTKRMIIYYNTTSDYGSIQCVHDGSVYTNLLLNPSGGNVGIGTTTCPEILTIGSYNDDSTSRRALSFQAGGFANPTTYGTSTNGDKIILWRNTIGSFRGDAAIGVGTVGDIWIKSNVFRIFTCSGSTVGSTTFYERLRVIENGYVGIGTTNPLAPLYVQCDIDVTAAGYFYNSHATGLGLVIRAGSGTSTEDYILSCRDKDNNVKAMISQNGGAYFNGNVSAVSFTDRTPFYEGDALSELKQVRGINGEIDHDTLPEFTKVKKKQKVQKLTTEKHSLKGKLPTETPEDEEIEVTERDLGATISMLTVAVQQLIDRVEHIEDNDSLITRITNLESKINTLISR